MITRFIRRTNLSEVSPSVLAAYARHNGWSKTDTYGDYSDVYVGEGLPEIVVPRTGIIGDYQQVVARLIEIFATAAGVEEISLYNDLMTADRDVIRVRVDAEQGNIAINEGANLVAGARDMLLAAACSLNNPRPVYRASANKEAVDYINQVRMGHTEPGSFVVTLLPPVIAPPTQPMMFDMDSDLPVARRMTIRLFESLSATRRAAEMTVSGDVDAFDKHVKSGISANLCDALVQMLNPFSSLDIRVSWAKTRPMPDVQNQALFTQADAPILEEAARVFRSREPKPDVRLTGSVKIADRGYDKNDGKVTLIAPIEDKTRSVTAELIESDYDRAVDAHKNKEPIVAEGDLVRIGQRWHLRNARIVTVITESND